MGYHCSLESFALITGRLVLGLALDRVFLCVGKFWSWCGALYQLTGFGPLCLTLSVFQGGGAVR